MISMTLRQISATYLIWILNLVILQILPYLFIGVKKVLGYAGSDSSLVFRTINRMIRLLVIRFNIHKL